MCYDLSGFEYYIKFFFSLNDKKRSPPQSASHLFYFYYIFLFYKRLHRCIHAHSIVSPCGFRALSDCGSMFLFVRAQEYTNLFTLLSVSRWRGQIIKGVKQFLTTVCSALRALSGCNVARPLQLQPPVECLLFY